jgi:hypothetical protein
MSRRLVGWLVPLSLLAGIALMLPFDSTATRVLGVACLLAFVVGGLFLIADPSFLAAEDEGEGDRP